LNKEEIEATNNIAQNQIETISELFKFIFNNSKLLYHNGRLHHSNYNHTNYSLIPNFRFTYLEYSGHIDLNCSNSHSAPRGKSTNFNRKIELPTTYHGFNFKFYWEYEGNLPCFPTKIFESLGIYFGSGSGNKLSQKLRYYRSEKSVIWLDDWTKLECPALGDLVNKSIIAKLSHGLGLKAPIIEGKIGQKYIRE